MGTQIITVHETLLTLLNSILVSAHTILRFLSRSSLTVSRFQAILQCYKRKMSAGSERTIRNEETQPSQIMSIGLSEGLPDLHTPHHKRRLKLLAGVVLVVLDLCCLPITYYYDLKFDTNLSLSR